MEQSAKARTPGSLAAMLPGAMSKLTGPTGVLAITTMGNLFVRMISTVILTRLLSPEVYGLVGIISSIFFTIVMLTDLGFQAFVVRHHRAEDAHFRNVIWTIHSIRGVILAMLAVAFAPLAAYVLDKPALALPLAVACLQLAIDGFSSIAMMAALRNNGAIKLSLLELALGFFQALVCIALALWLRNIWAIVGALLAQSALRTILSFALFPHSGQKLANDREIRTEFFAFSRVAMATSFLTLVLAQADKFFLAGFFTLQEFGLYTIAVNLALVPASFTAAYVTRIAYPIYAKTWANDPDSIATVYYGVRQKASFLFALGSGGLIGGAGLIVRILYDPRYEHAAIFLAILAVSSALRFSTLNATDFMTAIGKIKYSFYTNMVRVAWLAVAGPAGYVLAGGLGVVIAVGAMEVPALFACWVFLHRHKILNLRKELIYVALVTGSAVLTWLVASVIMTHIIKH